MAPKTILALAVGDPTLSKIIDRATELKGVRPYISGLIEGLAGRGHQLGTDFLINYQQCWHDDIAGGHAFKQTGKPALIYAMSTSVMRAAGKHTSGIPMVFPNCSNHEAEGLVANGRATGFSAKRTQTAGDCFDRFFRTVPTLKEVFVLHKPDYDISDHAVELVTRAARDRGVKPTTLTIRSFPDLLDKLSKLPHREHRTPANIGVHVTPVDLLFAATPEIIEWAQTRKNLAAFYPVGDWVAAPYGALGAYGVSQHRCGEHTAAHVHQILWESQPAAGLPKVADAQIADFEWVVSGAAAAALGIPRPTGDGARVI